MAGQHTDRFMTLEKNATDLSSPSKLWPKSFIQQLSNWLHNKSIDIAVGHHDWSDVICTLYNLQQLYALSNYNLPECSSFLRLIHAYCGLMHHEWAVFSYSSGPGSKAALKLLCHPALLFKNWSILVRAQSITVLKNFDLRNTCTVSLTPDHAVSGHLIH